jgi:hypothetical protein
VGPWYSIAEAHAAAQPERVDFRPGKELIKPSFRQQKPAVSGEIPGAARPQWGRARRRTRGILVDTPISRLAHHQPDSDLGAKAERPARDGHRHCVRMPSAWGSGECRSIGLASELRRRRHDDDGPVRGVTPLDGEALPPQQWRDTIDPVAERLRCQRPGFCLADAIGGAVIQFAE